MTRRINDLRGMAAWASDGPIGKVFDVLFDDLQWSVRYLAVVQYMSPGTPTLLVRPHLLHRIDEGERRVYVLFTRAQAAILPDLDSDMPVSRRRTVEQGLILSHVPVWAGGGAWGSLTIPPGMFCEIDSQHGGANPSDPHLRSFAEVRGYRARGPRGVIGRVRDMILDDEWLVSEIEIQRRGWAAAHRFTIPAQSVTKISWRARVVMASAAAETASGGVVPVAPSAMGGDEAPPRFTDRGSAELQITSPPADWDGPA